MNVIEENYKIFVDGHPLSPTTEFIAKMAFCNGVKSVIQPLLNANSLENIKLVLNMLQEHLIEYEKKIKK